MEERGLVERRDGETDRRAYALHLTAHGRRTLREIGALARAHDAAICAGLDEHEKEALARALGVIAERGKLVPGVHPGLRKP
jgi:DNA-binding MarR family transcriptional regulator